MSDSKVTAISFDTNECGKRVSDSKKKFIWKFKIGERNYTLSLISSALSGKRKVYLDEVQIYSEQNVLNYNFDFNHHIDGHNIRIFKAAQSVNNYDVRIDNRSFEYLLKKKTSSGNNDQKKVSQYAAKEQDPFSEFCKVSNKVEVQESNGFGDFDSFEFGDWKKNEKKSSSKDEMEFGFEKKSSPLISSQSFETNNYQDLQKNLNKNEDLLSGDFATNVFANNNNYLDLLDSKGDFSDNFGNQPKKKTLKDEIKCDLTAKQMANRTKMTAEIIKNKANDLIDSLI